MKVATEATSDEGTRDTDALITNTPGLCICVMSADCVPILLFDTKMKAIAAIHAGWKGTARKILSKTISVMQHHFNTDPKDLIAGIGPSICPQVYEVGMEVVEEFYSAFPHNKDGVVVNRTREKGYLDLWEANKIQLLNCGVPPGSIEVAEICTFTQSEDFFSARKSKNSAGRFAAGIVLK